MKFYALDDPAKPGQFAKCSVVGTWGKGQDCKVCTRRIKREVIISPLIIEWEPGTEKIGDFSWGGYDFIVTNRARLVLKRNHFECRFGRVKVRRPTDFLKSTRPRVAFPYKGPKLYWVRPTERVHIDIKASHIELEPDCPCPACGLEEYKFRRDRLVIRKNEWGGRRIFQIAEFGQSDATFIPESSLDSLDQAGLTNFQRGWRVRFVNRNATGFNLSKLVEREAEL